MVRPLFALLALLALAPASVAALANGDDHGCAEEHGCADGCDEGHAPGGEHAANGDDACGDQPCPCDGDGGDCPPNCHDCACSGGATSSVAPSGMLDLGCAPAPALLAEPPLERRAAGVTSRVFRPPRA